MIYKFTSVKEVIARVYRDLNLQDTERWQDMIEWIADALDFIGAYQQTCHKVEKLCINDYKVKYPCDLKQLNYIYYNGYPLKPSTSIFGNSMLNWRLINNDTSPDPITLEKLNGNPALLDVRFVPYESQHSFTLDPAYIRTSFKTGDVYISYEAIVLDEDGFPMIPDDISYKTACFWYIVKQLALPDWFEGRNNNWERADQQWQFYCGQAGAKAMAPDLPKLENIKNQWVRLIPDMNAGKLFFNVRRSVFRLIY